MLCARSVCGTTYIQYINEYEQPRGLHPRAFHVTPYIAWSHVGGAPQAFADSTAEEFYAAAPASSILVGRRWY